MSKHKHTKNCEHEPPVEPPVIAPPPVIQLPPVIEIQPPQAKTIHQVPIEGAAPILIPLLLIAAWVVVSRRKGK